jgi:hypothetical protein
MTLTNAHAYTDYEKQFVNYWGTFEELALRDNPHQFAMYSNANKLAHKILKLKQLKDKKGRPLYELKFSGVFDLFETCLLICANENRIFTRYTIAAVLIQESKLDRNAYNRRDGGKGIAQVMKRSWKEELPWYTNEFDKAQSIKACVAVLSILHRQHKQLWTAVRRYNGGGPATVIYLAKVRGINSKLVTV